MVKRTKRARSLKNLSKISVKTSHLQDRIMIRRQEKKNLNIGTIKIISGIQNLGNGSLVIGNTGARGTLHLNNT